MQRRVLATRLIRFPPILLLVLATRPALAEPIYPVSARLMLAPREEQHCLKVAGEDGSDCSVVEQAHIAFSAAIARMFTSGTPANLELVLTVTDADIFETAIGGMGLNVRTRVRILTAGGVPLDEITSHGNASALAQTAVDTAAGVAAENAARAFELSYARSSAVRDWLVGNKLAPAAAVSVPERSDKLVSASVGGGLVQGGGDSDVVPAPSVRVAGSFGRFVLQAMYSMYASSFQGIELNSFGTKAPAKLHVDDFGVEAGASFRLSPAIELRAGPGLHYLSASGGFENDGSAATGVSSSTRLSPSAFASLSTTFLPFRSGARFFAGLEARAYFLSTVDMGASGRRVPAANTSLGLTLGVEFPWGSSNGRAR
jgi:hypothetical protein